MYSAYICVRETCRDENRERIFSRGSLHTHPAAPEGRMIQNINIARVPHNSRPAERVTHARRLAASSRGMMLPRQRVCPGISRICCFCCCYCCAPVSLLRQGKEKERDEGQRTFIVCRSRNYRTKRRFSSSMCFPVARARSWMHIYDRRSRLWASASIFLFLSLYVCGHCARIHNNSTKILWLVGWRVYDVTWVLEIFFFLFSEQDDIIYVCLLYCAERLGKTSYTEDFMGDPIFAVCLSVFISYNVYHRIIMSPKDASDEWL